MSSRDQTLTIGSPFRFGFYAGIGFFFASALMSTLTFLLVTLIGLGSIIGFLTSAHQSPTPARSPVNAIPSSYSTPPQSDAAQ
jgi:hypothetical protein